MTISKNNVDSAAKDSGLQSRTARLLATSLSCLAIMAWGCDIDLDGDEENASSSQESADGESKSDAESEGYSSGDGDDEDDDHGGDEDEDDDEDEDETASTTGASGGESASDTDTDTDGHATTGEPFTGGECTVEEGYGDIGTFDGPPGVAGLATNRGEGRNVISIDLPLTDVTGETYDTVALLLFEESAPFGKGGFRTGTFDLSENPDYNSCGACGFLLDDVTGDLPSPVALPSRVLQSQVGTLTITALDLESDPPHITGSFAGFVPQQLQFPPAAPFDGGCETSVDSAYFDLDIVSYEYPTSGASLENWLPLSAG